MFRTSELGTWRLGRSDADRELIFPLSPPSFNSPSSPCFLSQDVLALRHRKGCRCHEGCALVVVSLRPPRLTLPSRSQVVGEEALSAEEKLALSFLGRFENEFVNQGVSENRSM